MTMSYGQQGSNHAMHVCRVINPSEEPGTQIQIALEIGKASRDRRTLREKLDTTIALAMIDITPPVQLIEPKHFGDARGWFTEVYSVPAFAARGIACTFVQDNHSLSVPAFTLRGLHFQTPPHGQDKLIRCIRGRIFDVAVDVRRGSPTYGQWIGAELSAENGQQLFIPIGFAHGFLTLEPDCEVSYKCSDTYAPDHDGGIRWDDPAIGIDWPIPAGTTPELSAKDLVQPRLANFDSPFAYDGRPLEPLV